MTLHLLAFDTHLDDGLQELPLSSPGVVKKTAINTKHASPAQGRSSPAAHSIWQAIQSAPGSVSKMLAPAMSPISHFFGSASQAVKSAFMRAPIPAETKDVTALQRKLEGNTPQ